MSSPRTTPTTSHAPIAIHYIQNGIIKTKTGKQENAVTMFNLLPRKAFYLPFLLLLLAHHQITAVGAYDPDTGSAVAGNLTASAPWGVPPDKFESATKSPDASAAFSTLGYNVSDTAPSPASVDGWTLAVGVAYDVSLSDAADAPAGADGDDAVFQATTLYLGPPAGMAMNDAWRICAAVFPGVAETAATAANAGGSCHEVLSSDCLLALGVTTGGMNGTGACNDIVLPERCNGDFPAGTGNISTVGEFSCLFFSCPSVGVVGI